MKPGDRVSLQIEKGVYGGRGLARSDGRVVFVSGALPGDRVRARVDKVKRDFAEAALEAVEEPGPARREPPCAHAARCGGCTYQPLEYEAQVALKRDVLVESLSRARVPFDGALLAVTNAPEQGWRWRARLHVGWEGVRPVLGFREEGSHALVDVERCPQLTPGLAQLADELRCALAADVAGLGGVEALRLGEGGDGVSRAAVIDVHRVLDPQTASRLAARVPSASGLGWQGAGPGAPFVRIVGEPYLFTPRPHGVLRSHVLSFFQGNGAMLEVLERAALAPLAGARRVLELYSGVGLFTLPLAARAEHVRAVEGAAWAAADARHNLAAFGHVQAIEAAVDHDAAEWAAGRFDAVLLDPPRAGAGPQVVDALARTRVTRVAYVSCDPTTLARDLARLRGHGFVLRSLHLLDLFPDTYHLETVAALER